MVAPPDVAPLVGQHLRQVRLVQSRRYIDAGPEHAQHERSAPPVAAADVILHSHRRPHLPVKPQIADQHIRQHECRARQPYRRQHLHRHNGAGRLHRLRGRDRSHRLDGCQDLPAAGQDGVRRLLCLGQLLQRRRHGALLRLQADAALQGDRHDQPHRHQRPQHAHRPLGRAAQRQPRQHHRQRQHAGLPRKLHHSQKQISHDFSPQDRRSSAAARLPPPPTIRARPRTR